MLHKLRPLLPDWLFGAFCLLIPALYNSFPLITADSGAYIANAYLLQVPLDRPIGYSAFVRIASLGLSLWCIVLAQAALVSLLMLAIVRHVLGVNYHRYIYAALMLLVGVATSAGWFAGQVMPDIFTAVVLLTCCLLLMADLSKSIRWLLYILLFGCTVIHNSNLVTGLLLGVILLCYAWRTKSPAIHRLGVALMLSSVAGWLTLASLTAIAGRGFRPSAATHVFIMSRMAENGVLDAFLRDQCPSDERAYKLCAYREHIGDRQWEFMWNPASPLYQTGGWQANENEYNRIIRTTLTSPKYLMMHIVQNTQATFRQLPLIYIGDALPQLEYGSSPYKSIAAYDHNELKEYRTALQANDQLHLQYWNAAIAIFSIGICIVALLSVGVQRGQSPHKTGLRGMVRLTLLFLLINAAVSVTLATVVPRYEARVFWVLPFLATLHLIRRYLDARVHSQ